MNKKRLFLVLRILLVGILLFIILSQLPIYDRVVLKKDGDKTEELKGWILANEESEDFVRFEILDGEIRKIPREEIAVKVSENQVFPEIRYGFWSTLKRLNLFLYILAFFSFFGLILLGVVRWVILLRCRDISITFFQAFRLTFVGFFFNNVVPGLTGGDLVKAYYVARKVPKEKTTAVISVFLDRIIGLVALAVIAGIISLFAWGRPGVSDAATAIFLFVGAACLGGMVFFSKRIRKVLQIERILKLLPFNKLLKDVDSAIFLFRYKKKALATAFFISILGHFFSIMANVLVGEALNPVPAVPIYYYFIYIPIALVVSSIPITPAGLGVAEFLYPTLFMLMDPRLGAFAFALCILYRMITVTASLFGGVFLLFGEGKEIAKYSEES